MIVTSPSNVWLEKAAAECRGSFSVSSPYIGSYLSKLALTLGSSIQLTVLTRTTLADFAAGSSDLDAVTDLARRAGGVLSLSSLHAKLYILDHRLALITSANATHAGMYRNKECGYQITNKSEIRMLAAMLRGGFGSMPAPQLWTAQDLAALREPTDKLRAALPRRPLILSTGVEEASRFELKSRDYSRLIRSFSGWLQLTLEGVSRIRTNTFSMDDVFAACAPLAKERFPDNRYVREKLRQQMQRLRDLGLILFLGHGRYERLAATA